MTVQKLPEDIIRGIAAGEVVERPASVLKELLENAVDAGSRRVEIEWRDAGRGRLRITDDGVGMSPEDARLALERHATSKINSLSDLERLTTYGFRGEALPSIGAVSKFTLITRPAGAPSGHRLRVEAGRLVTDEPAGAPIGTTVLVEDLFFAVPARLKFLKSDATERGLILRTIEDLALAEPTLALRVLAEGRELFSLPSVDPSDVAGTRDRLALLWGNERVDALKPVDAPGHPLRVSGWVSDVHGAQSSARHQRFFINRRPVVSRRLTHALYDAYRGRLPVGRHPAAVLFLEIDPLLVDVNVHPTKREVRLSNEEQVHDFLHRAVREALSSGAQMPTVFAAAGPRPAEEPSGTRVFEPAPSFRPGAAETRGAFRLQSPLQQSTLFSAPPTDSESVSREDFKSAVFVPLAQLYDTYLLARRENTFVLFDQHAAAERALYERLMNGAHGREKQGLLLPWIWEPSSEAAAVVLEQREAFDTLGFELEPFGGQAFRVKSVPAALGPTARVREILEGLVDDLLTGRIPRGFESLLTRAACRGSVMAGQTLAPEEMDRLIRDLQQCQSPWTCPHGRPTFLSLANEDLAKRFRRV